MWIANIEMSHKLISHGNPVMVIETNASKQVWGASSQVGTPTGGRWGTDESHWHINCLEMKAAFFGLKCFCENITNTHVRLLVYNSTTVAYINFMGGLKSKLCNRLGKVIWKWCLGRDIWVSTCHITGSTNVEAEKASRQFNDRTEWMLNKKKSKDH